MGKEINLIKKYKLEAVKKRFDEMNRYNGYVINEAEGDPNDPMADPNQAGGQDPMGGPNQAGGQMPGGGPMGGPMAAPDQAGGQMPGGSPMGDQMGDPNQAGGQMPGGDPMGAPDQAGGQMPGPEPMPDQNQGGEGEDDGLDAETEDDSDDTETDEMEEGDEVIDVDDLTMSQEETERELGTVNKNMVTLLKVVNKCIQAISDNDKKLEDLMAEYERRNPTEDEKTNVRVRQGVPFTDDANSFWSDRGQRMYDDNMIDPRHYTEYIITLDDVKDANTKDVADSIAKFPSKLTDFLKF